MISERFLLDFIRKDSLAFYANLGGITKEELPVWKSFS
jgi:TorA maturation chaperone TorD